jgi:hypothetical protein
MFNEHKHIAKSKNFKKRGGIAICKGKSIKVLCWGTVTLNTKQHKINSKQGDLSLIYEQGR